jgi:transposase
VGFVRGAVELVRSWPERAVAEIAAGLDVCGRSLREWVERSRIGAGGDRGGVLTTAEREELRRLWCEVAELRKEKDILRKAGACFVAEATRWSASGSLTGTGAPAA